MSLDEINLLTLENSFFRVLNRLVNFWEHPELEQFYTLDPDDSLTMYERVELDPVFTKPTLEEMEAEFLVYKQELIDEENARLAEIARREALQARIDALPDLRLCMDEAGLSQPNSAIFVRDLIDNDDTIAMDALEAAVPAVQIILDEQAAKEQTKESAKAFLGVNKKPVYTMPEATEMINKIIESMGL